MSSACNRTGNGYKNGEERPTPASHSGGSFEDSHFQTGVSWRLCRRSGHRRDRLRRWQAAGYGRRCHGFDGGFGDKVRIAFTCS